MQPHHSKQAGSLFTALVMVFTMLGVPPIPAYAGAPASVHFALNSLSAPITTITRVSVDSSGAQGSGDSWRPSISADGRYAVFQSSASNLVSGDTNGTYDIFMRDTQTDTTTCISVDLSGVPGNGDSYSMYPASISADGRYVAFESHASNLVSGDANGTEDIFLRDTQTSTTTLVSVNSSEEQGFFGFWSEAPAISADGRYVAFGSYASNLVSGDENSTADVFLRDTLLGTTTLVSVDSSGTHGNDGSDFPSVSANGRYVAFYSMASNLVSGDTNGKIDIFLRDTLMGTTTLISVNSDEEQGNADSGYFTSSISADGRYVAFDSMASNLVSGDSEFTWDVFLRDTLLGTTTLVSANSSGEKANYGGVAPSISADGRYVAFSSSATNLVSGDANNTDDVFRRDILTGTTVRLSLDSGGVEGNNSSGFPSISGDGSFVAFNSMATNLVSGDTNGKFDVFVVPAPTISRIYLPLVVR